MEADGASLSVINSVVLISESVPPSEIISRLYEYLVVAMSIISFPR